MNQPTYFDLSHTISDGLITYKGLPAPLICDFLSREDSRKNYPEGTEFHIGKIEMVGNTGTYIDFPYHRYLDGKDACGFAIAQVADLEVLLVNANYVTHGLEIGPSLFEGKEIAGKAILVYTGWAQHWNTERYYSEHPFLNEAAATYLKSRQAKLVGIDSYNIDDTRSNARPAHSILLGDDILIVEHMCGMDQLPQNEPLWFSAVPPKVESMGSWPVRAFARTATLS